MKRFMRLSLLLFGVGIALVAYALIFGPNKFSDAAKDEKIPVGEIQYDTPDESPQQPWLESEKKTSNPTVPGPQTQPASR